MATKNSKPSVKKVPVKKVVAKKGVARKTPLTKKSKVAENQENLKAFAFPTRKSVKAGLKAVADVIEAEVKRDEREYDGAGVWLLNLKDRTGVQVALGLIPNVLYGTIEKYKPCGDEAYAEVSVLCPDSSRACVFAGTLIPFVSAPKFKIGDLVREALSDTLLGKVASVEKNIIGVQLVEDFGKLVTRSEFSEYDVTELELFFFGEHPTQVDDLRLPELKGETVADENPQIACTVLPTVKFGTLPLLAAFCIASFSEVQFIKVGNSTAIAVEAVIARADGLYAKLIPDAVLTAKCKAPKCRFKKTDPVMVLTLSK